MLRKVWGLSAMLVELCTDNTIILHGENIIVSVFYNSIISINFFIMFLIVQEQSVNKVYKKLKSLRNIVSWKYCEFFNDTF